MSSRLATAGVIVVSAGLVGGGLYFALGGSGDGDSDADEDRLLATRPTAVVVTAAEPDIPTATDSPPSSEPAESSVPASSVPASSGPASSGPASSVPVSSGEPPEVAESTTTAPPAVVDGDGTLPVANVVGQSQSIAESRLANFEVEVEVVDALDDDDFDTITAQTPLPGSRLPPGGLVSIELSVQPTPETVEADRVDLLDFDIVDRPDVIALGDGECAVLGPSDLVDPDGQRVLGFEPIDCDEPHDAQMITTIQLQSGPDVFDVDEVTDALRRECRPFFEEFVGVRDFESNVLGLFTVRPEPDRYDSEGDRTAFCMILVTDDVRVIGSAENSLW